MEMGKILIENKQLLIKKLLKYFSRSTIYHFASILNVFFHALSIPMLPNYKQTIRKRQAKERAGTGDNILTLAHILLSFAST